MAKIVEIITPTHFLAVEPIDYNFPGIGHEEDVGIRGLCSVDLTARRYGCISTGVAQPIQLLDDN